MEAWMPQSWNVLHLQYVQKMSSPFLLFALGLLRRSLDLQLLLFVLKKLQKHLLKGVDRFLLSMNHIELLPLDLGLLFKVPGHFFKSPYHIREGFFSYGRVRGL